MSNRANKLKVGIFVIVSFILLFVFLSMMGMLQALKPVVKCMTIVNSSVQGLSVGAKVKYDGVAIGQVTGMKISTEEKDLITIYMDINPENFAPDKTSRKESIRSFTEFIEKSINNGLRCQLRYEGITGTLYQEIRFFDEKKITYKDFILPENIRSTSLQSNLFCSETYLKELILRLKKPPRLTKLLIILQKPSTR